jgi:hypothetical protein
MWFSDCLDRGSTYKHCYDIDKDANKFAIFILLFVPFVITCIIYKILHWKTAPNQRYVFMYNIEHLLLLLIGVSILNLGGFESFLSSGIYNMLVFWTGAFEVVDID